MVAHVAYMGRRKYVQDFVGISAKKKSLGRHRCKQEYNIKTYVKNRWESMDWINLAQDMDKWQAFVSMEMSLRLHKMQEISDLAKELLGSQEKRCCLGSDE